ncbi:hypothetical protein QJS10_CPB11g00650 [Acorus calamus]|uniref:HpcH/HpaI aldolase/citrate lyase domain-containing protein n=1 Tax=Acorus calamus TaxID=4465 RepID=A0AAV9DU45_ACOCL|nr:hypothetical protein QJS10_CPB11g00650 [Acorus calamus]
MAYSAAAAATTPAVPSTATRRTSNPSPSTHPMKTLNPKSKTLKTTSLRYASPSAAADAARPHSETLKSRLASGETLYGLFLLTFSPDLAEIAGLSGYDYVVVDMEHGHGGVSAALPCLRALAAASTPAILRLPESSPTWAKKALDLGPAGVMFPMIESVRDAELAVSACRFPPRGVRGSAHTVVRASRYGIDDGYLEHYEEELLILCQVETETGVNEIGAIAAVDGVDCVHMGPLDLSASVGCLWDPGNRKVRELMRRAERGVLEGGNAYIGGFAMPHDGPEELKMRGYHMVSGAVDVGMFRNAAVEDVARFRMAPGPGGETVEAASKKEEEEYYSE